MKSFPSNDDIILVKRLLGETSRCISKTEGFEPNTGDDYDHYFKETNGTQGFQEHYYMEVPPDDEATMSLLADRIFFHGITGIDIYAQSKEQSVKDPQHLNFDHYHYSEDHFQGILPDTGASGCCSIGYKQFLALQKIDPRVVMDTTTKNAHTVTFGKGSSEKSLGTIKINTPLGVMIF